MEWQNSQVVWTALDQRNLIGAPQFGQLATLSLMDVRPLDAPDVDHRGAEFALEVTSEVPVRTGLATEYIQTNRLMFGKSMTGEVRFGKQAQAGNAVGNRELAPLGLGDRPQRHGRDQVGE